MAKEPKNNVDPILENYKQLKNNDKKIQKQLNYFFNRELSWIKFNERVLEEAKDKTNPLLERLKFLCIFATNLDEFFMIRVAGLKEQQKAQIYKKTADGLTASDQMRYISDEIRPLVEEHGRILSEEVLPELEKNNVRIVSMADLSKAQAETIKTYFYDKIFPVLTPLAIDPSHPFPKLQNLSLNLLVELKTPGEDEPLIAVVPVPKVLPSFYEFQNKESFSYLFLEDIIQEYVPSLFPNVEILNISQFRVTRNADLDIQEAEADDLLKLIERELRKRNMGTLIRLEVTGKMYAASKQLLKDVMQLREQDIFEVREYLNMGVFMQIFSKINKPDLKDEPFTPALHEQIVRSKNIFEAIKTKDLVLWHPYDNYFHVVDLVNEASVDPHVLAIKITLYRTSGSKSPIVQALKKAVLNGKQVTALIELKARFDEEKNIVWAKELEREGVNVVYGLMGLKTHCKTCLIIREEGNELTHYVQLSTGNFNETTAKIYTDLTLMTANKDVGKDISELFNVLTGYSKQDSWRKISVAPINLRQRFLQEIENCIIHHKPQKPSKIRIIMNALVDPDMIKALYLASQKGVKIDLIVRGICTLVPTLEGVSDNIRVRSIVGRFLEHSRIYCFEYDDKIELLSGSADWMERNLNRRIELVFPILDPITKKQVLSIIDIMLKDNEKARFLMPDGNYIKRELHKGEELFNAQDYFLALNEMKQKQIDTTIVS